MCTNKLIVRIAEGLGNQMFMYAHAYALAKKINYNLLIDNSSGYFKKKNQVRGYQLDNFKLSSEICDEKFMYNNYTKDTLRKIYKKIDFFLNKKSFLIEKRDKKKVTQFIDSTQERFADTVYIEGYYQSDKYFFEFSQDIKNEFKIKNKKIIENSKYINLLKQKNSVSICIRQNRFSEGKTKDSSKSDKFTKETIDYVNRAIKFVKNKIQNPSFFIWSNSFENLSQYFDQQEFTFIENETEKMLKDFELFSHSKHFIVGPTSFHWWGAYINNNPNKICIRPNNINPSNNINYWPKDWISI